MSAAREWEKSSPYDDKARAAREAELRAQAEQVPEIERHFQANVEHMFTRS